jgi:enoyl-CoA hydratase/carnithine racemase
MNADVVTTSVADGIAVVTLGSATRIYMDDEMGVALTEALDGFAGDAKVRVVVVTGGAPGYFIRHFSIAALLGLAESLRASGREWPENATYNGGFFDKAMALCESMPKPVSPPFLAQPWPVDSSSRSPATFVSPRMATT